jgi:hypothetical protein
VLNAAGGIRTNPAVKNDVLQTYVIATGTDGYKSVISSGEIAPNFGHKADLLAIGDTGGTLPGSAGMRGSPPPATLPAAVTSPIPPSWRSGMDRRSPVPAAASPPASPSHF